MFVQPFVSIPRPSYTVVLDSLVVTEITEPIEGLTPTITSCDYSSNRGCDYNAYYMIEAPMQDSDGKWVANRYNGWSFVCPIHFELGMLEFALRVIAYMPNVPGEPRFY